MLRPGTVLGIARSEMRQLRRMVRYWIFVSIAVLFGLLAMFFYSVLHGFSGLSGTLGIFSLKYVGGGLVYWYLLVFAIGAVFLAFDIRARDAKNRMSEVLDSRPYSNLELVAGRFLGQLVMCWLPLVTTLLLAQLAGWLTRVFDAPIGDTIEPSSLLSVLTLMSLPAFAVLLGLVFFISLLVRNRLIAAVASLVVLGGWTALAWRSPFHSAIAWDLFGGLNLTWVSELMPKIITGTGLVQRVAMMLLALGLVGLSAAVHPRLDGGSKTARWIGGGVLVALAAALCVGLAMHGRAGFDQHLAWRAAHQAREGEVLADLRRVDGRVEIDPGDSLALDLDLTIAGPQTGAVDRALFSFNPGLEVAAVSAPGGALAFTHENGLLEVELPEPLTADRELILSLEAAGRPVTRFAYLNTAREPWLLNSLDNGQIILGLEPSFFDRRYVALMPGIHWLPTPGSDTGRLDVAARRPDFFDIDLEVSVPEGWLPAGPGRRRESGGAYRFAPGAPVPEVGLMAARFERRAIEIEGVEAEVLVHPSHTANLELFTESAPTLAQEVGDLLRNAAELGIPYPYDGFSLVEVPLGLRTYRGGWRMDTALAMPGMMLMVESTFPTSRLGNLLDDDDDDGLTVKVEVGDTGDEEPPAEEPEEAEEEVAELTDEDRHREHLRVAKRFFENDVSGGNLFTGAARNFFAYQSAASGGDGVAINMVTQDLAQRLLMDRGGFFSAYLYRRNSTAVGAAIAKVSTGESSSFADAVLSAETERPAVWDQILEVSLGDIDYAENPERGLNALVLKGGAVSRWLADGLGAEGAAGLLAALRAEHGGGSYTREDLVATAEELGIDLPALLGDWLDSTRLPGFVASSAEHFRLEDDESGLPRYQVLFNLRNSEPVPGMVRVEYSTEEGRRGDEVQTSDPFRIPAGGSVEVGLVGSAPLAWARVIPYLALNRGPFEIRLPEADEADSRDQEPLRGTRVSEWVPEAPDGYVVDDLDEGFEIAGEQKRGFLRQRAQFSAEDLAQLDQGLPEFFAFSPPKVWSRGAMPGAYGRYRRTVAVVTAGDGSQRARYSRDVPAGRYWLELHLPPRDTGSPLSALYSLGSYNLVVETSGERHEIEFDASESEAGWNLIDEFELNGGTAAVELSSQTTGGAVIADAIRWRPAGTSRTARLEE